ncbi:hypothetical protein CVV68_00885 [Arthrobacter livingstonensis]|uniref:VOC domain-containing protein n=1 Tax=Arthrobacter livingstonensis TaxID=670078 RepID=A0A2V5M2J9_9MICC|nr:VOC family protein [Arthrobacter livingstonensis]PYI69696.1 hypothetical protein CVV68_00885 [Arthrobacter livingstonensis]
MLRVRPVLFTSRMDGYAALLVALGLKCTENYGDWRVFDCGDGKIGLRRVAEGEPRDGTTAMSFELRDPDIFVRRTLADGTRATLLDSDRDADGGPLGTGTGAALVTAPGGFSFLAEAVTDLAPRIPGPLTVVQSWLTPDVDAARKVLADIGARPTARRPDGRTAFQARNGGLVAVHPHQVTGVELGLEYDGDLTALGARLTQEGIQVASTANVLTVRTPDGGRLRILRSPVV